MRGAIYSEKRRAFDYSAQELWCGEVQLWEKPIARVPREAQNYGEDKTPHHQCL